MAVWSHHSSPITYLAVGRNVDEHDARRGPCRIDFSRSLGDAKRRVEGDQQLARLAGDGSEAQHGVWESQSLNDGVLSVNHNRVQRGASLGEEDSHSCVVANGHGANLLNTHTLAERVH